MYKFKKDQLMVALTSWWYAPCLVITDTQDKQYTYCYSVGFRSNRPLKEIGAAPYKLCFIKEELRIATFRDILENQFIYEQYRSDIKDILRSLVKG